jgi:hypothetical protein
LHSISVSPPLPTDVIEQLFRESVSEVLGESTYEIDGLKVFAAFGSKFFLRADDYVGVALFVVTSKTKQRIDFGAGGGNKGSGWFGLTDSAAVKFEKDLLLGIENAASKRSSVYAEISVQG